jgi:hypothetical protein
MGVFKKKKANGLKFSNLGLNHNKNNAGFKVRVEWGYWRLKVQMEKLDEKIRLKKEEVQSPFQGSNTFNKLLA